MPATFSALVRAELRPDERPIFHSSVAVPRLDDADVSVFASVLPLLIIWHKRQKWRSAKVIGEVLGVSLTPISLMVLTNQRLLFWSRDRRGSYSWLGQVPREAIIRVTTATIGIGWRTCELSMASGATTKLRLVGQAADDLAAAFP